MFTQEQQVTTLNELNINNNERIVEYKSQSKK